MLFIILTITPQGGGQPSDKKEQQQEQKEKNILKTVKNEKKVKRKICKNKSLLANFQNRTEYALF